MTNDATEPSTGRRVRPSGRAYRFVLGLFLSLVALPVAYWLLVYWLGTPRAILLNALPSLLLILVSGIFVFQNVRTLGWWRILRAIFPSLAYFLPVLIVAAPGLFLCHRVEALAVQSADRFHAFCQDRLVVEHTQVNVPVEKDASVWWNPYSWGKKMYEDQLQTVSREIRQRASLAEKLVNGAIVSAIDLLIMTSRLVIAMTLLCSFGYVFAMVVITRDRPVVTL